MDTWTDRHVRDTQTHRHMRDTQTHGQGERKPTRQVKEPKGSTGLSPSSREGVLRRQPDTPASAPGETGPAVGHPRAAGGARASRRLVTRALSSDPRGAGTGGWPGCCGVIAPLRAVVGAPEKQGWSSAHGARAPFLGERARAGLGGREGEARPDGLGGRREAAQ